MRRVLRSTPVLAGAIVGNEKWNDPYKPSLVVSLLGIPGSFPHCLLSNKGKANPPTAPCRAWRERKLEQRKSQKDTSSHYVLSFFLFFGGGGVPKKDSPIFLLNWVIHCFWEEELLCPSHQTAGENRELGAKLGSLISWQWMASILYLIASSLEGTT